MPIGGSTENEVQRFINKGLLFPKTLTWEYLLEFIIICPKYYYSFLILMVSSSSTKVFTHMALTVLLVTG